MLWSVHFIYTHYWLFTPISRIKGWVSVVLGTIARVMDINPGLREHFTPAQAAGCWLYLCKYMQITFPTLRWPSLSASCGSAGENIIHQSKLHQFGRYSTSILKMQNSDDCIKFQSSESGVLRQMSKHNSSDRNCTGPWLTYILIMGYVSYTYNTLQMMNDLFGDLQICGWSDYWKVLR